MTYTLLHRVLSAGSGSLALSTLHCGDPIVILNVDPASLPAETSKLLLRTRLNEQDGKDQWFSPSQTRLAIRLPPGARGGLSLDLIALDLGECKLAQATLGRDGPHRTQPVCRIQRRAKRRDSEDMQFHSCWLEPAVAATVDYSGGDRP